MTKEIRSATDAIAAPLCQSQIWCFHGVVSRESRLAGFLGRLLSAFPLRSAPHCIVHLLVLFFSFFLSFFLSFLGL